MNINGEIWTENRQKKKNTVSIYKGVKLDIRPNIKKPWITIVKTKNCYKHLSMFKTEKEAALFYNQYIIDNNLQDFFSLNVIND